MAEAPAGANARSFAAAFAGAAAGVALVLWVYDTYVVQPREARRAHQVEVDLAQGRTEAQAIAGELDASVDRSLDRARTGFDEVASDQDKARLAMEAVNRAAMYKVALSEVYMSNGAWPAGAAEAGLPAFDAQAPGAVRDITVGPQGVVTVELREPFATGSRFVLTPRAGSDGSIQWTCRSEGDPGLRRYVPACAS